ncbi:hypothetical protein [Gibbsiella quercinecans]|uniref:hypothetical protein n=1 Tax=Gibbsiella quercinecans TaxID=929813 RepID=UPI003A4DE72A
MDRFIDHANWNIEDFDLREANEAFAAQILAVNKAIKRDTRKGNINGGEAALGHPIEAPSPAFRSR